MDIFDSHLRRLGVLIIALRIFLLVFYFVTADVLHIETPNTDLAFVLLKAAISAAMAVIAFIVVAHKEWTKYTLLCSFLLIAGMVVTLILGHRNVDSLIDVSLLLITLVFYLQVQIRKRIKKEGLVNKREANTLDLRVSGRGELFNPMVMAPHPEPNQDIVNAIDRFLNTLTIDAPLNVCIHSSAPIAPTVQYTMAEVLRFHYQDEMKRVERFLENRYIRSIVLIISSIAVLRVLPQLSGVASQGVVWQIFSNFAAFSLWQIGATYFERVEAYEELTRIKIAMECNLSFY